ncbi:MAG: UDP-N-acetylmuramoyl-L-alanine--D-glutamate ligase [Candidatus Omnitrophica bacterium]|nr:UDP-N-acetylmuramoyl-L-alanine--D-glutamate ligase [Candidatus Omnitrophota bacterium]
MNYRNKRVTVVGLGVSGFAAACLLKDVGARARVTESAVTKAILERKIFLERKGIKVEVGGHRQGFIAGSQLFVASPGVGSSSLPLRFAQRNKIPVIGEVELASTLSSGEIIAVSGTNGKTTVVSLLGEIFKKAGKKVVVCGNIGHPFSAAMRRCKKNSFIILEISSFQLERIKNFRPRVAVLLNIDPDHLDWHQNFSSYKRAKSRLFLNQKTNDDAILNQDDDYISSFLPKIKARKFFFSRRKMAEKGVFVKSNWIISNLSGREERIFNLERAVLKGAHNCENYLAAAAAALIVGISPEIIGGVFKEFSSLPHHTEFVRRLKGVSYIDDSKATNLDATQAALQTFPAGKIILILGGRDKGCCFHRLSDLVKKRVKQIILLGEAAKRIEKELSRCSLPIRKVSSLKEAVRVAKASGKRGDFVLLSPACSSFDMFADYKERGNVFKKAVQNLS